MENERRAAEFAAAEMRGRATAKKEALLVDERATDARVDKYMECAAHSEAKFINFKDEDAHWEMDEAQEWKRLYETLEARVEVMLSVLTTGHRRSRGSFCPKSWPFDLLCSW